MKTAMNEQLTGVLKAVSGQGDYAHLNTPSGRAHLVAWSGKETAEVVASKIIEAGRKRRGEIQ